MAGHSKWHNIQHRKGSQDAKRGKIFTKLIREITTAARVAGEDPSSNPRLRTAIDKALTNNMTKDTIQRAIKRGAGGEDGVAMSEIRYEGYGPHGVAVMVDCLTDNKNRTVGEVRHAFTKCGGNLGTDGSVSYLFTKTGFISFGKNYDEEKIMEIALENGADDVYTNDDDSIEVQITPDNLNSLKEIFVKKGLEPASTEISMTASTEVKIDNVEHAAEIMRLSDMLEDLDDVQNVYMNVDIPDQVLEKL